MTLGSIWMIFLFFFSILACRPITVLIHELGHAIPSLFFTDKPVTIYVGSYGDKEKSWFFSFGRLRGFLSYDIFQKQMGICYHYPAKTILHTLLIILGGPLASLIFGGFLLIVVTNFQFEPLPNFLLYLLVISAVYDFIFNVLPTKEPSYLHDGSIVYNDGYNLQKTLRERHYPDHFQKAKTFIQEKKYKRAIRHFYLLLDEGFDDKDIFILLIESYYLDRQYPSALDIYNKMLSKYKLNSEEYGKLGSIYWKIGNYEKVLLSCNRSLQKSYTNARSVLLKGRAFLKLKRYDEANTTFDQLIAMGSSISYLGYSFKGLALLKKGELLEGKKYIDIATLHSPENAYVLFHQGIYFYKKQNFDRAMYFFQKAHSIDNNLIDISAYIASTLPYLKD